MLKKLFVGAVYAFGVVLLGSGQASADIVIDSITLGPGNTLASATVGGIAYAGGSVATSAEDRKFGLLSIPAFDSNSFLTAGSAVPSGRTVSIGDADQRRAIDGDLLTGVAGGNSPSQNGGALILRWNGTTGITDTDTDPDFFVFEDSGNDAVAVHAILADGTLGSGIALSNWGSVSTSGVLPVINTGSSTGRTVSGTSFNFTDLLDASGAALTSGTAIQGIVIGDTFSADFYDIYANVELVTPSIVPEPSSAALLIGVACVAGLRHRKR